ncbi:MAG: adenylylsulfate kinase [Pelagibacterales bacterium]|nr:adenylylsulfate kinase [Pelagibacterales bacterium]|tara:strand:- start:462 stop:998 length:537 start_codon:yes stop_codon:yes gene_type:complete
MVIWITGISGAGKTTIAKALTSKYKKYLPNLINVDGDAIRELFGKDLDYSERSRVLQIQRIQKICFFLSKQELIVIASALYASPDLLKWNRENFTDYFEVYLKASVDLVKKRDPKNLYKKYDAGIERNIVGLDIPWHEPKESNIEINMQEELTIDMIVKKISNKIKIFQNISLESNEN